MQTFKIKEIINLIDTEQIFEATDDNLSFKIKINKYVPYCCMAIHDGDKLRNELKPKIAIDNFERWYEEDPSTGEFIKSLPITIIGLDSRFEYDLNRNPQQCIYSKAWDKSIWKNKLSSKDINQSLKKHDDFYKVVKALIQKLVALHRSCIVYDIHSYNYQRWERDVPLFNIGTEEIDSTKYAPYIEHWKKELSSVTLTGIENKTAINDVFFGRGYNLKFITSHFPNVLVLATEIKKIYCNEKTGEAFPGIIESIKKSLKKAISDNALFYSKKETTWRLPHSAPILDKKEDHATYSVDKNLFKILKGFELLVHVNPINAASEYNRFTKNKYTELPKFKYSPIKINPFELKKQLSLLPTKNISNVSVQKLYESVIDSFFEKADLLATLNSKKFLYNSLRYFGRPGKKDIQNANYLLHLPPISSEPIIEPYMTAKEAFVSFQNALKGYDIACKMTFSSKVIAHLMVINSTKTILMRPDAKFTIKEINALIEHEIGVHMVTTQNSIDQKLKIFNLGLPVNTMTQEGLAILAEYLSGNITLKRLKELAQRVIIIDMMCGGADFIECFNYLTNDQNIEPFNAYTMVTRIFRGGGFTKDYLYLNGFVKILRLWKSDQSLLPLLVGKASLEFYDTIQEMIDRGMVDNPLYVTKSIATPNHKKNPSIYDYIISGLK